MKPYIVNNICTLCTSYISFTFFAQTLITAEKKVETIAQTIPLVLKLISVKDANITPATIGTRERYTYLWKVGSAAGTWYN